MACSPWNLNDSEMTEQLTLSLSLNIINIDNSKHNHNLYNKGSLGRKTRRHSLFWMKFPAKQSLFCGKFLIGNITL